MLDNQTYIYSFRYFALVFVLFYFAMVLFGKKRSLKFSPRIIVYVIITVLIAIFALFKYQQLQVRKSLRALVSIVDYNMTVDERLANCNRPDSVIFELNQHLNNLNELIENNSSITKIVGKSASTDTLISRTRRFLNNQLFRANNINRKSFEHFSPTEYVNASKDIHTIKPEGLGGTYISAGLTIDEISTFRNSNTLLVRIVQTEKDSVLYEQAYIPQSGVNAFVLPNYFNSDKVELQLGYVNKHDPQTYHYIVERPYERK